MYIKAHREKVVSLGRIFHANELRKTRPFTTLSLVGNSCNVSTALFQPGMFSLTLFYQL